MNTGIWIDSKKAILVSFDGEDYSIKEINSEIEARERFVGESKDTSRFGQQHIDHQRSKERKQEQDVKQFFKEILGELDVVDNLVIFGPAEMKIAFKKVIENDHRLSGVLRDVISADNMTENQVIAWVKDYYKNY